MRWSLFDRSVHDRSVYHVIFQLMSKLLSSEEANRRFTVRKQTVQGNCLQVHNNTNKPNKEDKRERKMSQIKGAQDDTICFTLVCLKIYKK